MLSLKNPLVYLMFHPLAYIVKLKIEMSMAELIAHVSRVQESGTVQYNGQSSSNGRSENGTITGKGFNFTATQTTQSKRDSASMQTSSSPPHDVEMGNIRSRSPEPTNNHFGIIEEEDSIHSDSSPQAHNGGFVVHRHDEVTMEVESAHSERSGKTDGPSDNFDTRRHTSDSDEAPLRKSPHNMGLATKVWGRY